MIKINFKKTKIIVFVLLIILIILSSIFYINLYAKKTTKNKNINYTKNHINVVETNILTKLEKKELDEIIKSNIITKLNEKTKINKDVFAWLRIPNTKVNDIVVHTSNNEYYLSHDINNKKNSSGELILETDNNKDLSDSISFIFGHNCLEGEKFTDLMKYFGDDKENFLKKHPYIQVITKNKYYKYDIIGTTITLPSFKAYPVKQNKLEDDINFFNKELKLNVSKDDHIIILSTCLTAYDDTKRRLVFGKLSSVIDLNTKKHIK